MASEKFCLSCAGTTFSELVKHFGRGRDLHGIPQDRDDKNFFESSILCERAGGDRVGVEDEDPYGDSEPVQSLPLTEGCEVTGSAPRGAQSHLKSYRTDVTST